MLRFAEVTAHQIVPHALLLFHCDGIESLPAPLRSFRPLVTDRLVAGRDVIWAAGIGSCVLQGIQGILLRTDSLPCALAGERSTARL